MSLQALKDRLPDYAKDIKLNLGSLASEQVQAAVRIAAVVNAAAAILDAEAARDQAPVALAA